MTTMKMQKCMAILIAMLIVAGVSVNVECSIGLSTRFVDVTLENVVIGEIYNLRKIRKIPYAVTNRGDIPVEITVDVIIPPKESMSEGYEPIPDPSWIQLLPNTLKADAHRTAYAEIILRVPNDPVYANRHYQALVRSRTSNTGLFSASTRSRLRFSTGAGPESLKREAVRQAMMQLDFEVSPADLFVPVVQPGIPFNIKTSNPKKMMVTNRAESPMEMKFNSIPWSFTLFEMQGDYVAAPDPSWLKFVPETVVVDGESITKLEPVIQIPDEEVHYGKRYAFLVKVDIVLGVELDIYNRIYVQVADKKADKK